MSLMLDRLCEQACACSPSFFKILQLRQKMQPTIDCHRLVERSVLDDAEASAVDSNGIVLTFANKRNRSVLAALYSGLIAK